MKIYVEIEVPDTTLAEYEAAKADWHPTEDDGVISIDAAYLPVDPTDDSFVLLKLIGVTP